MLLYSARPRSGVKAEFIDYTWIKSILMNRENRKMGRNQPRRSFKRKRTSVNEGPLIQILVTASLRIFGFIYSMLFPMVSL